MKTIFTTIALALCMIAKAQTINLVKDISPTIGSFARSFVNYNNKMYFMANDDAHGTELWQSQGTAATTSMCFDYKAGASHFDGVQLSTGLGKIFMLQTIGATSNYDLLSTDGTLANTISLDQAPQISPLVDFNGAKYYLQGSNVGGSLDVQIKKTDGTVAGTTNVLTTLTGYTTLPELRLSELLVWNNKLYFTLATNFGNWQELCVYDPVTNVWQYVDQSADYVKDARYLTVFNNKLYFDAYTSITPTGRELFSATAGNAVNLVAELNPGAGHGDPFWFYSFDNKLFFNGKNGISGYQLYALDGGTNTIGLYTKLTTGTNLAYASNYTEYKGNMYFSAVTDTGIALYKYAPTTNTVTQEKLIYKGTGYLYDYIKLPFVYKDILYFMGADTTYVDALGNDKPNYQLYECIDNAGTNTIKKVAITPAPPYGALDNARDIIAYNGAVYFNGKYSNAGEELQQFIKYPLAIDAVATKVAIAIYPNPFVENFTIDNTSDAATQIIITNANGAIVQTAKLIEGKNTIALNQAATGIYCMQLLNEKQEVLNTYKLLKTNQ